MPPENLGRPRFPSPFTGQDSARLGDPSSRVSFLLSTTCGRRRQCGGSSIGPTSSTSNGFSNAQRMRPSVKGYRCCWLRKRPKCKYSTNPPKGRAASQYDRTLHRTPVPLRCRTFDCRGRDGRVPDIYYGKCFRAVMKTTAACTGCDSLPSIKFNGVPCSISRRSNARGVPLHSSCRRRSILRSS
jgi:hypothetical protein